MQKLVVPKYMRTGALLLLILVSMAIIFSYSFISSSLALAVTDFYKEYWQILTHLFVITGVFLIFAYSVERDWMETSWLQRFIAFAMIAWFAYELYQLIEIADILLAFTN